MNREIRYGLLLVVAGLLPHESFAFIYELKIMHYWDAPRNRHHYVFGCSDFHDKTDNSNGPQRTFFEKWLTHLDKPSSKILVEDLSSRNDKGNHACGRFFVNSRGGILGGLTEQCRAAGLDVDNIEFRFCRVSSLGPVLNNLQSDMFSFPSAATISVATLVQEISAVVNEIRSYNDGPLLGKLYEDGLRSVLQQLDALKMYKDSTASVADYLKRYTDRQNRVEVLKKLLTFDSELLDFKLAHSIVNAQNKEKVFAIAGGSHVGRVCDLLEKIGYEKVYSTNISFAREYDVRKCLGSHIIEGKFCVKPQAVALDVLEKKLTGK